MKNSPLKNKSELLQASAELLHESNLFPAVAHAAYYSCYQLLENIWLYSMGKSDRELASGMSRSRLGSHEYLLNEVVKYVGSMQEKKLESDARSIRNDMPQLKRLRVDADYLDNDFDYSKSQRSISMSKYLRSILIRY